MCTWDCMKQNCAVHTPEGSVRPTCKAHIKEKSVVCWFLLCGWKPVAQAHWHMRSKSVHAALFSVRNVLCRLEERTGTNLGCYPKSAVLVVCPVQASSLIYWRSPAERQGAAGRAPMARSAGWDPRLRSAPLETAWDLRSAWAWACSMISFLDRRGQFTNLSHDLTSSAMQMKY